MTKCILTVAIAAASVFFSGCGSQSDNTNPASKTDTNEVASTANDSAKARALAAKKALFEQLSSELKKTMSSDGPVAAITVCNSKAAEIAKAVGKEHGLKIGRTSFKLRNPKNAPPGWTQTFVEERAAEPQFVDVDEHTFGAFLPIKLMPQCMTCHGPKDQIDPAVMTTLSELYPDDQATGFAVDDLRGWFWVEVPKDKNKAAQETATSDKLIQFGEMREVIGMQKHQGRVRLEDITAEPNLYAVGAIEGLQGEVTIVDGIVTATQVDHDGKLAALQVAAESQATLLIGDRVTNWVEHKVETAVAANEYDDYLTQLATSHGIDVSRPFVFSAIGDFVNVQLHVIHGACPVHAKRSGVELPPETRPFEGKYEELTGTLVGVYAQNAAGVLTHPGVSTHTHVVFALPDEPDLKLTGHVESIGFAAGTVIRLPAKRTTN